MIGLRSSSDNSFFHHMLNAKNDLRSPFFTPTKTHSSAEDRGFGPNMRPRTSRRSSYSRTRSWNLSSPDGMISCNLSQENSSLKLVYSILSTPFPSNPAGRTGARLAFLDGHLGRWSPAGRRRRDFGQATSEVTQTRTRGYDHPKHAESRAGKAIQYQKAMDGPDSGKLR